MVVMVMSRHTCVPPPKKIKAAEETNDLGLESMPTVNSWLQLWRGDVRPALDHCLQ